MSRLTKYEPREYSMFPYQLKDDELSTKLDSIHKLGKLEDLEDELGCPLEVVVKALNGFYTEFGYISNEDDFIYLRKDSEGWYLKVVIHPSKPKPKNFAWFEMRRLKDYQKTWWLKGDKSERELNKIFLMKSH